MCLRIFRTVLGHAGQNDFGVRAQHGELDVQRRVEHGVGRLLEGEYPAVFGLADVLPLGDGLPGGEGSLVVVAYDAAQQPVVADGYPVVVVQRYAGQRRDVYLVFHCVVNLLCQQRVQCVYALDDEHGVGRQLQPLAVPLALARDEVVLRNLHALALD